MTFLDMVREQRMRSLQLKLLSFIFMIIFFSLLCAIIAMASQPTPTQKSPSGTEGASYFMY